MTRPSCAGLFGAACIAMAVGCTRARNDNSTRPSLGAASAPAVGEYLTDANGRAVYMFVRDQKNTSECAGPCAAAWPPLPPTPSGVSDIDVSGRMIGTISRADDRRQVTYNGMPVYYYEDDEQPGDIKGQGKNEFGGLWYLVSPKGDPIRPATQSATALR